MVCSRESISTIPLACSTLWKADREVDAMILTDVNVLVYAFRTDAPNHAAYRAWLTDRVGAREAFGLSELVLSSVLRLLTHPRVFSPPEALDKALEYLDALRGQPNCV